jgi:hypothetical protein
VSYPIPFAIYCFYAAEAAAESVFSVTASLMVSLAAEGVDFSSGFVWEGASSFEASG